MSMNWTGEIVGLMHVHKITGKQLAEELGQTDRYISMVLCGHREPAGAEERFREALQRIIERGAMSAQAEKDRSAKTL